MSTLDTALLTTVHHGDRLPWIMVGMVAALTGLGSGLILFALEPPATTWRDRLPWLVPTLLTTTTGLLLIVSTL